jgi:hypothetical protein
MNQRTRPQNKLFHAQVSDVARAFPLVPWKRAMWHEAWKRYLIAIWVNEARWEAYGAGDPDPFPVRPVPSSALSDWQMNELIECTYAVAAQRLGLILE